MSRKTDSLAPPQSEKSQKQEIIIQQSDPKPESPHPSQDNADKMSQDKPKSEIKEESKESVKEPVKKE